MKGHASKGADSVLHGYTIVEVMIFLAVSSALLVAVGTVFTGRQERARFSQAVVSLEQDLQDVFNDVSTGYFPSAGGFKCSNSGPGSVLSIDPLSASEEETKGKNEGCIFVGKQIRFNEFVGGDYSDEGDNQYNIYTLVGSKDTLGFAAGQDIRLLGVGSDQDLGVVERNTLGADIEVIRSGTTTLGIRDTKTGQDFDSLIIATSFNGSPDNNVYSGNASSLQLYLYKETGAVNEQLEFSKMKRAENPVAICMKQPGNGGRFAALIISKQLTIERQIDGVDGKCTS